MISVLIPTYNYHVTDLVKEIHKQLIYCKIPFEILCLEDGSDKNHIQSNKVIDTFSNTRLLISVTNKGRISSRKELAEKAKYNWLLFLDADTFPVNQNFIFVYLQYIDSEFKGIFGGINYKSVKPEKEYLLRWKYGRKHEQKGAEKRNQNPYNSIVSANFLIDKEVFLTYNSKINKNNYGFDAYFGSLLKKDEVVIKHIDNAVFHLGIEKSEVYLDKKEEATRTLLMLYRQGKMKQNDNNLLDLFLILKRYKFVCMLSFFHEIFSQLLKRNLLGKYSYIPFLQVYRILYMCHTSQKKLL